jgi:hypothetical protein
MPAFEIAIKQKPDVFSQKLLNALKEDPAAQAKSPEDIVGIDWDPFLNSQDPEDHYELGSITEKNGSFRVDIHGVRSGARFKKPSVIAEVKQENGRWLFVNFHRTDGSNLLATLRLLKQSRKKAPH